MLALISIFVVPFIGAFVFDLLRGKKTNLKTIFFVYIHNLIYSNLLTILMLGIFFGNDAIGSLLNTSVIFFIQYICFMLAFTLINSFIYVVISKYVDVYIEETHLDKKK